MTRDEARALVVLGLVAGWFLRVLAEQGVGDLVLIPLGLAVAYGAARSIAPRGEL